MWHLDPRLRSTALSSALLAAFACAVVAADASAADAKADLEKLGVKVSGTQAVLLEEVEFGKELAKAKDRKASLAKGQAEVRQHEKAMKAGNDQLNEMRSKVVRLNAELAEVAGRDVAANNRIVGQINALAGQINLMAEQREKFTDEGRKKRGSLNEEREEFVQQILGLRSKADAVEAAYAAKQNDPAIRTAIDAYASAEGKELSFGPQSSFRANLRKLKSLEDLILSEDIPLVRDGGVQRVSVMVNGEHVEQMIVDSGCSSMLIPHRLAEKFSVQATEGDQEVTCVLADGRTVKGVAKRLRSVRVGKFTVENVDCVVLGPDAVNAELLLGMSFLGNFEFKVNADAGLLTMVKVDDAKSD